MRRLIILILASAGVAAHGQNAFAEEHAPAQPAESSVALGELPADVDPLATPPPQRATRKQRLEALDESARAEASEPSEFPAPMQSSDGQSSSGPPESSLVLVPPEPSASPGSPRPGDAEGDDTWLVDDRIADEEVAAYEDTGVFVDPGSIEQAQELARSAGLQLETNEFRDAARTINSSVDMLEEHLGRYDPTLIEPLIILGQALHGQGEYPDAIDAYERAVHVARINDGLHTPDQVSIIYHEADSWAAMGEIERANDRHVYAYETLRRAYGGDSVEMVPGMYTLAHWYSTQNNIFSARGLYQYAARALTIAYGAEDVRLIPALRGIAKTYRLERFPPYRGPSQGGGISISSGPPPNLMRGSRSIDVNQFQDGERALQQIVRIQEANPEATVGDVTVAVLELADWNLMFESWERAFTLYEFCYQVMGEEGQATEQQLTDYFGEPRPLYLPLPSGPGAPPANLSAIPTQGFVEMRYSVSERGQIHKLTTIASEPPGLMDFRVRRAMRTARFRPRIAAGVAVGTTDLVYRHRFEYYPLPEHADPSAKETARESAKGSENAGPEAS